MAASYLYILQSIMNWIGRVCIIGTSAATLWAQQPSPAPLAFDAATIKPNLSGSGNSSTNSTNGLLRITNQTVRNIIQYAYDVRDFQLSGGPGWMGSDRYDVTAKPENGVHEQQLREMLRTLLADRFQLRFHRETREVPVYTLTVGKNGAKLHPAAESPDSGTSSGRNRDGLSTMKGTRVTLGEIAANLAARLGRPVVDKTGLSGKFDFELSWVPDLSLPAVGDPASPATVGPSLLTAVQEQLGLRLESARGPVGMLVIDKVERPSEN